MNHRAMSLGLDFGTEAVRAVLVDVHNGQMLGSAHRGYRHGVMEDCLEPAGIPLPPDFALQNPADYLEAAVAAQRAALRESGQEAESVVGVGVDFTACTMLPVDEALRPLCEQDDFQVEPHAFAKLWKHHGANDEAGRINALAQQRGEPWLARYGGTTSSEWMLAKAWETLRHAPEVYGAADRFVEAGDWVVATLCGAQEEVVRGACAAGYKGMWRGPDEGFVDEDFLRALDPALSDFFARKLRGPVVPAGQRAGGLCAEWSQKLGLREGLSVSAAIIDAHAAVPGCGVVRPGQLVIILGTSSCHMLLGDREVLVPGIQGVVQDGILPGFAGYEAGQAATGDLLDWCVDRLLERGADAAEAHRQLSEAAAQDPPGASGLLVLDWWNGNRSILIDPMLSGAVVGLTRNTRPEDLYRAMIEGTAFGTRKILENFEQQGVRVDEVFVCGGVAEKNELLLQIYADVTGRRLRLAGSPEVCALGAAVFGALAAGRLGGGHEVLGDAVLEMVPAASASFEPRRHEQATYDRLYALWSQLHDHFGREAPDWMRQLRELRAESIAAAADDA